MGEYKKKDEDKSRLLDSNAQTRSVDQNEPMDMSPEAIQMRELQANIDQSAEVKELMEYQEMANRSDLSSPKSTMPTNEKEEVFLAITNPVAESGAAFYGHDTVDFPALGFTTRIAAHDGPDIDYGISDGVATPTLIAGSDEGSNDSWALAEGTHIVPDETINDKPIHVIISAAIAADILTAEQEHVNDYQYAKGQILDRADDWLQENLGEESFGPVVAGADATEVEEEEEGDPLEDLVDNFLNAGLQEHLGLTGVADFEWANIGSYYRQAADQTEKRDESGWHSFGNDDEEQENRILRTITTGDSEVNTHDSASVIDLTEVS